MSQPNSCDMSSKHIATPQPIKQYQLHTVWIMFIERALCNSLEGISTSHKHGLATKFQNGGLRGRALGFPFETNFFKITDTYKAETLASRRDECLHAIGEDDNLLK